MWFCSVGNNSRYVYITIFAYVLVVNIIALILAIQTRKVKIKILNDYKYTSSMVYIFIVLWVVLGLQSFILPWNTPNISEVVFSGGLLLGNTILLCLTFIPKVLEKKSY